MLHSSGVHNILMLRRMRYFIRLLRATSNKKTGKRAFNRDTNQRHRRSVIY